MTEQQLISSMGWQYENTEMSARFVAQHATKIMYSEDDMRQAFMQGHNVCRCVTDNTHEAMQCFDEWFNQFKNK